MFNPSPTPIQARYEQALVCENGHLITDHLRIAPERVVPFCKACGAPTLSVCPSCSAPIQGDYIVPGVLVTKTSYRRPTYCPHCGQAMPWTIKALNAARELAADVDSLTPEERQTLEQTLPELLADTPMTKVAASRFKRLMLKPAAALQTSSGSFWWM